MGYHSHVILNVGNNMGKYSHDIHNIGIREQAALFSQKNPSYVILGVNSFTKISQLRNSMSQFFPNYWEFSHLIPNWEFRKVSCVSIPKPNRDINKLEPKNGEIVYVIFVPHWS